mmetsp:Transcript_21008/g.35850  ORF Transcript_21008/g.35850 Transcript_21008/m.35850 type:complete len:208 (+) Transcript_21008:292-915(+)
MLSLARRTSFYCIRACCCQCTMVRDGDYTGSMPCAFRKLTTGRSVSKFRTTKPWSSAGPKNNGPAMAMRAALVSTMRTALGGAGHLALRHALIVKASTMTIGAWMMKNTAHRQEITWVLHQKMRMCQMPLIMKVACSAARRRQGLGLGGLLTDADPTPLSPAGSAAPCPRTPLLRSSVPALALSARSAALSDNDGAPFAPGFGLRIQ